MCYEVSQHRTHPPHCRSTRMTTSVGLLEHATLHLRISWSNSCECMCKASGEITGAMKNLKNIWGSHSDLYFPTKRFSNPWGLLLIFIHWVPPSLDIRKQQTVRWMSDQLAHFLATTTFPVSPTWTWSPFSLSCETHKTHIVWWAPGYWQGLNYVSKHKCANCSQPLPNDPALVDEEVLLWMGSLLCSLRELLWKKWHAPRRKRYQALAETRYLRCLFVFVIYLYFALQNG